MLNWLIFFCGIVYGLLSHSFQAAIFAGLNMHSIIYSNPTPWSSYKASFPNHTEVKIRLPTCHHSTNDHHITNIHHGPNLTILARIRISYWEFDLLRNCFPFNFLKVCFFPNFIAPILSKKKSYTLHRSPPPLNWFYLSSNLTSDLRLLIKKKNVHQNHLRITRIIVWKDRHTFLRVFFSKKTLCCGRFVRLSVFQDSVDRFFKISVIVQGLDLWIVINGR